MKRLLIMTAMLLAAAAPVRAQTPAYDPSDRLREVLPAAIVDQVLARIAEARAQQLPAAALEHRALELAAKRVDPELIAADAGRTLANLESGRAALHRGGEASPSDDEVVAAGSAMGKGVDGAQVSELAKSAPSGRSLAVPLFVISSLVDRGLPSDEALARVLERLQARASDADLSNDPGVGLGKPALTGQALAATKAPAIGGRPTSVPPNRGADARPDIPTKPDTPGGRP